MVGHVVVLGTEAPNDVIAELRTVDRQFAFGIEAAATAACLFTAAIAVSNQVALTITWVVAACHPGTW